MGGLTNILKGKTTTYKADPLAGDINAAGKAGIAGMMAGNIGLNAIYNQDPTQMVNNQIAQENKMLGSASNDATKRMGSLVAQRGMGSSSIGLGQIINQSKGLSDKMAMNNASGLGRIRDVAIQNGEGQMNAGQGLWGIKASQGPVQMQDVKQRSGGLAGIIGGAAGAYIGAKTGNMAGGMQTGMAMGNAFQNS